MDHAEISCLVSRSVADVAMVCLLSILPLSLMFEEWKTMKFAGFFLLFAGFFLAVAALVLLPGLGARIGFVLCALALEATGLTLAVRSHMAEALEVSR